MSIDAEMDEREYLTSLKESGELKEFLLIEKMHSQLNEKITAKQWCLLKEAGKAKATVAQLLLKHKKVSQ